MHHSQLARVVLDRELRDESANINTLISADAVAAQMETQEKLKRITIGTGEESVFASRN